MSMKNLLEASVLLENNLDKGYIVGPKAEIVIRQAEEALGLNFPPTYRLFLQKYGFGGLQGFEVYGIINQHFENNGIKDGIGLTLDERKTGDLPSHFIIISDVGDGFWYVLDASQPNAEGEYPVVIWGMGIAENKKEKVNEDFGEWLLEHIRFALSEEIEESEEEKEKDAKIKAFWQQDN